MKFNKILITLISLTVLYALVDLVLGHYLNDGADYMCRDPQLHHRNCPNTSKTYRMQDIDGGKIIVSHWNKDSVRVLKHNRNTTTNFAEYDHVLVGDSFIEQRQINFGERISSLLNEKNFNSIQIGTGSWNFINYRNFIVNNKFKKGAYVHVFLMANDFYSKYGLSTFSYYKSSPNGRTWPGLNETIITKTLRFLSDRSFTYQALVNKTRKINNNDNELPSIGLENINYNCDSLKKHETSMENLAFSLIEQAYDETCFSNLAKQNLNISREIIIELKEYEKNNSINILYYFIPFGTIFKDEAFDFKRAYGLSPDSIITTAGMYNAINQLLSGNLINFEEYLINNKGDSLTYYHHDGHWNKQGSYLAAKLIQETILSHLESTK